MKALLVAIDAKFIQTNLAVRSLKAYVEAYSDITLPIAEYTVNQPLQAILESLYHSEADVYLFSSYIWNINEISGLVTDLKKIKPNAKLFIGGPEATYNTDSLLAGLPALDGILVGEGELTLLDLLGHIRQEKPLATCAGLALHTGYTALRPPADMNALPFPYDELSSLAHRLLYYESMRGCPFGCTYCLSSIERGVRFRSLALVYQDIDRFLQAKVPQVKFVDRTFNCKASHAMAIWQYLHDNDNGVTNFHFELAGELITDDMIALLTTLRPGLVQFEIGVQSTHKETLKEIDRHFSFTKLASRVVVLQKAQNIHLHLDLIAGLPYEGYTRFQQSFNEVYALRPHTLQLGFLKVLGGSKMQANAQKYQLLYQEQAPYEVLCTKWITFTELSLLHGVDDMVDHYYNSGRYANVLEYLLGTGVENSPFAFYLALSQHYITVAGNRPLSKMGYFNLLGSFQTLRQLAITEEMQWLCKFDLLLHENLRKMPDWVTLSLEPQYRDWIREFYSTPATTERYLPHFKGQDSKSISRITHMEVFPFHPKTKATGVTAVLFDYTARDVLGNATAHYFAL